MRYIVNFTFLSLFFANLPTKRAALHWLQLFRFLQNQHSSESRHHQFGIEGALLSLRFTHQSTSLSTLTSSC